MIFEFFFYIHRAEKIYKWNFYQNSSLFFKRVQNKTLIDLFLSNVYEKQKEYNCDNCLEYILKYIANCIIGRSVFLDSTYINCIFCQCTEFSFHCSWIIQIWIYSASETLYLLCILVYQVNSHYSLRERKFNFKLKTAHASDEKDARGKSQRPRSKSGFHFNADDWYYFGIKIRLTEPIDR